MAAAFLSVACAATSAPLNPGYRAQEYDFYLSDLSAKALIVLAGAESSAIAVAKKQDIPILELTPLIDDAAGLFTLSGQSQPLSAESGPSQSDDVALVLHTSGTTSRPKIVPLTHRNLCTSAYNIGQTLQLTPQDRCLNIMPLFHIHGLMAATLSSLAAGASVACTPGFYAPSFFEWMADFQPTWYTAVPTMHQAILARAPRNAETVAAAKLRFIRSSSASLPPQVMSALGSLACRHLEDLVRRAMQESGLPFVEAKGEAAFYGPKIDIQLRTVTGREETFSTNQLDFAVPQADRMNLTYVGSDDRAHHPYVIHRAPLGTHERFIAYLIEHFGGAFPTWLAPVQVRILPVSEKFIEYAEKLEAELRGRMIRAEVDRSDEKVGKKVREAITHKIPNALVVGDKEQTEGTITLRRYGERDQHTLPFETFVDQLERDIKHRVMRRKPGV